MTAGMVPGDLLNTIKVLQGLLPAVNPDGTSWLRHGATKKAMFIDLMLLQGATPEAMANAVGSNSGHIESHIACLQDTWNGDMAPHGLIVSRLPGGVRKFVLADLVEKALSIDSSSYS
ncbi:hypothetical protein [Gallaecimonas pentaromativorans]|uniref:hypothetical protein n=1 Tax=Gallaecimonas pentaromativorans TaxID=584787 RepID=UPI00067ED70E|nr:hypothetical protein [Gallaecimonas pentaromativorans]